MPEEEGRGSQPQGKDKGGKLPELGARAGLELCAQLLQFGVGLATQLLDISVHVVEALAGD